MQFSHTAKKLMANSRINCKGERQSALTVEGFPKLSHKRNSSYKTDKKVRGK